VIALGVWVWSWAHETISQRLDEWRFERGSAPAAITERASPFRRPRAWRGELLGRLEIPRLHLYAMVREGSDDETLDVALGHITGTALPGQGGNMAIAGHRDTLFHRLREIGKGDVIRFQNWSAAYIYNVDSIAIVQPQTVSVLAASNRPQITLVTCYPFHYIGAAPERFIVKAHLVLQIPQRPGASGKRFAR
jgi:LPXTG-site transpeptidase (sortase) family protein